MGGTLETIIFYVPRSLFGDKEVRELPVKVWRHIKENQG